MQILMQQCRHLGPDLGRCKERLCLPPLSPLHIQPGRPYSTERPLGWHQVSPEHPMFVDRVSSKKRTYAYIATLCQTKVVAR